MAASRLGEWPDREGVEGTVTMWDAREVRSASLPELIRLCGPLAGQLEVSILRQDAVAPASGGQSSDVTPILYRVGAADEIGRAHV